MRVPGALEGAVQVRGSRTFGFIHFMARLGHSDGKLTEGFRHELRVMHYGRSSGQGDEAGEGQCVRLPRKSRRGVTVKASTGTVVLELCDLAQVTHLGRTLVFSTTYQQLPLSPQAHSGPAVTECYNNNNNNNNNNNKCFTRLL